MTAGVVRVGETVRRPRSPASAFTALLLSQLALAGFDGAPGTSATTISTATS